MPVRSLNSSVLRWPDGEDVLAAARQWAKQLAERVPTVLAVGCFGHFVAGKLERQSERLTHHLLVIDHKHTSHPMPPASTALYRM